MEKQSDRELYNALVALRESIDRRNSLQEESNALARSVNEAVRELAKEIADARQANSGPDASNQETIEEAQAAGNALIRRLRS